MPTLHFGFEEDLYPDGRSTVQVAEILEAHYHIVEHFLEYYHPAIQQLLHEAVLEHYPEKADLSSVEQLFRNFLNERDLERLDVPGVPTEAAQEGTHRNRKGQRRKSQVPRASFVDLGLYRDSFRAWLE